MDQRSPTFSGQQKVTEIISVGRRCPPDRSRYEGKSSAASNKDESNAEFLRIGASSAI